MIGEAAGFETVRLQTFDVYDRHIEPEMAQMLVARGDDLSLRGENIQYLARKVGVPKGVPEGLYHGDPTRMHGVLSVAATEAETGLVTLEVENTSQSAWTVVGAGGSFTPPASVRLNSSGLRTAAAHCLATASSHSLSLGPSSTCTL